MGRNRGYGNYPKCDTIMNRAMRYFVGVHRFAPTAGVVGDMGWSDGCH